MFDSKFHEYQSMKLQLRYEITFGYVQKLQIAHLIPLQTINIVSYRFSLADVRGLIDFLCSYYFFHFIYIHFCCLFTLYIVYDFE